jgi:hypothetical protein
MNESCHRCPNCNSVTFGTRAAAHPAKPIICPKCQQQGMTVVMVESEQNQNNYMGDGLFTKNKNLNESKDLLNESV